MQASADGTTWRTVDERRKADIYTYSAVGNQWSEWEGYNAFNGTEPFQWRCLAPDNVFNCEGSVQVDEGATLDLSCVPDANISIRLLTVDAASGGGTIVKFRPAANGTLALTGGVGDLPSRYELPLKLVDPVSADFDSWRVTVDGEPSPATRLVWADGVLSALTPRGTIISFR